MAITVIQPPPDFRTSTLIRAAHPVRSSTWWSLANAVNYLHGNGGALLSLNPYLSVSAGSTVGFDSYVWPRYENPHRIWTVTIRSTGTATGTITNGTETVDWVVSGTTSSGPRMTIVTLQETVTASATPGSVSISVTNNADSAAAVVNAVNLYELPRTELDAGYGVQQHVLDPMNPIVGATSGDLTIEAVARHARSAKTVARKSLIFNWSLAAGQGFTSTSFVDLLNFKPEIRCRYLEQANTTRNVAWTAFTSCPGGETGEIKLTASQSGATDTMSFNNAVGAWQTPRTLEVKTEDPTRWLTDTGLRGGNAESVTIQARRVSGGTTVTVLAIAIGEST